MAVPVPIDLSVAAAPQGWGGDVQDFATLFLESVSGQLDPTYLIGVVGGPIPTHDEGPYFDGAEWWFFDPLTGQYQPGDQGCPIGTIAMWGGVGAPARWLLCDGRNVSRFTYSRLFQRIGTTWGVGDGQSSFGLPPAGKFYVNAAGFVAAAQVPIDALPQPQPPGVTATDYPSSGPGARGGAQLSGLMLATDLPSLAVQLRWNYDNYSGGTPQNPGGNIANLQWATSTAGTASMQFLVYQPNGTPTGKNQEQFSVMPPYAMMNHIIKYQ